MKTNRSGIIASLLVTCLSTSLAFAVCNPPPSSGYSANECTPPAPTGAPIAHLNWSCCDEVNLCTNGAPKFFTRGADIFLVNGNYCWVQTTTFYPSPNPCCS